MKYQKICPRCDGKGKVRRKSARMRQFIAYIQRHVRRGSMVEIGAHYRKVVEAPRGGILTLVKIRDSWTRNGTTTYTPYDYIDKFHGVRK